MPHYNRWGRLRLALSAYDDLYEGYELEIIVCDDGSDEIESIESTFPLLRVDLPPSGPLNPCVPINRAVEAAKGDLILLTSPEVIHRTPVLRNMAEKLENREDYVSASVFDAQRGYLTGRTARERGSRAPYPPGSEFPHCALLRRDFFWHAGGYDEDYRHGRAFDDNDFLWRLERAGAQFHSVPDLVYHVHEPLKWNLPSNEPLFRKKWPDLYS